MHIQDIESYDTHKESFEQLLNELDKIKRQTKIKYRLGYSNYTFDLWIILHKMDLNFSINHRKDYIKYINNAYGLHYLHIADYKRVDEFKKIINQITLIDVISAIRRAEQIREDHEKNKDFLDQYKEFSFYHENPDLTVHKEIKEILTACKIIK